MDLLDTDGPFGEFPMFLFMLAIIFAISYVAINFKDWIKPQDKKDKITSSVKNEINRKDKSKALAKEQNYSSNNNIPMKGKLKSMIQERMIRTIKDASENSPMKNTPFEGLIIQNAIGTASEKYKENFLKERHKLGMSEIEIKSIVDEVSKELLDRFLE